MSFSFSSPNISQFSEGQAQAYQAIVAGHSICVAGPAGTGKSTVLNALKRKYGRALSVTASTGVAALNVEGSTLHTFAGLGLAKEDAEHLARLVAGKKKPSENIRRCAILVIEEISMISDVLFTKLDKVFQHIRRNKRPFGGVQLVLTGDFLQLPPVDKKDSNNPTEPLGFAFESPSWKAAKIETIVLTKVHRQADQAFADALRDMRMGVTDSPAMELIYARNNLPLPTDGIRPVVIETHNYAVDAINASELAKLTTKEELYHAFDTGDQPYRDKLDKDCLAPKQLKLKEGAQVMLLKNLNLEDGLANGSLGTVVKFNAAEVTVKFLNGNSFGIARHKFQIMSGESVLAEREQFPLRLAYAVTSHKVQGLTLDRILCRLGKAFECGQSYVAISRVKTLGGLFLQGFTPNSIMVHPRALLFYQTGGRNLSQDEHMEAMLESEQSFLKFDEHPV